ncbi:MAG: FkbM family methyltransferase [Bacteroidota bacterium]
MKKKIKAFLLRNNVYYKLRYSFLFRIYLHFFKAIEIEKEKKEIEFYKSFLPPCDLIFDIGANDGHKTEAFLRICRKIVSCEPDKKNFHVLQTRFSYKRKRVFLENIAVTDTRGKSVFHIHHPGSAFNTLSLKWKETLENDNLEKWNEKIKFSSENIIQTTTLDLLIKKYGTPDFIKIDVEGYEENVLKGLSQPIPFISFEGLWPEASEELQACFNRLENLDKTVLYNIAVDEKLLLDSFTNRNGIIDYLEKEKLTHLEIIVKMNR